MLFFPAPDGPEPDRPHPDAPHSDGPHPDGSGPDGRAGAGRRADGAVLLDLADHLGRAVADGCGRRSGMELAATVLWARFLRSDASDPDWPDRDRVVPSATRLDPLLAALLELSGYDVPASGTVFGHHPAVEMASGPPGQGFATAVGMAAAERAMARRFGRTLVDHRTWVLACETDLSAGVSLEAAALAARLELDKLVVIADAAGAEDGDAASPVRFAAAGWAVRHAARNDPRALLSALSGAVRDRRPTLVSCSGPEGSSPSPVDDPPFADHGSGDHRSADPALFWRELGRRGASARRSWLRRKARHRSAAEFDRAVSGQRPHRFGEHWRDGCAAAANDADAETGALEGSCRGLILLDRLLPELIPLRSAAGAAFAVRDAEPERATAHPPAPFPGRGLECGVAEHGMAALGNGLSLHGGALPVIQAGLVSVDRMRPALRLAALMGQPVVYLLHEERGTGAAWQAVEQLASLRAMPSVRLFRPAGAAEALACWELALGSRGGPSVMALSAGNDPWSAAIDPATARDGCSRGGYLLADAPEPDASPDASPVAAPRPSPAPDRAPFPRRAGGTERHATLLATGPEVAVALQARRLLAREGIRVAVASVPCWELFAEQPTAYRAAVLGEAPRIGIEAASGFGWERWLGPDGIFIGLDGFGAAGPAGTFPRSSGISPELVAARVRHHPKRPVRMPHRRHGAGL